MHSPLPLLLGRAGRFELVVGFDAAVPVVDVQDVQCVVGKGSCRPTGRAPTPTRRRLRRSFFIRDLPLDVLTGVGAPSLTDLSDGPRHHVHTRNFRDASGITAGGTAPAQAAVVALVGDDLAVIGQAARRDGPQPSPPSLVTSRSAASIAVGVERAPLRRARRAASSRRASPSRETTSLALAISGMPANDLGDLPGIDEHALDLGALVGAAHPALDPRVGAAAGRQRRAAPPTGRRCRAGPSDRPD